MRMLKRKLLILLFLLFVPGAISCVAADQYQKIGPVQLTREGNRWAEKTLKNLSLEEKIGQLIMVRGLAEFVNLESPSFVALRDSIRKYHLGSVIISVPVEDGFLRRSEPYEAAMFTNLLQRESRVPLIFAADFERGLYMRLSGVTMFPHAMAFGAAGKASYAEAFGNIVAQESRAIGVQWNFFPVMDVNSNPANPIINTRSFGEDPALVGALGAAYIVGSRRGGLLSTAKHFPGHGDTGTDSHLDLAQVGGDMARLDSVELPPFQKAIAAGVDAIMVAHVSVPAIDPAANKVATNSEKITTDLLKYKMAFKGLVVTDAMEMRGFSKLYPPGPNAAGRAAVDAFKAGNDMLLLPSDLEGTIKGMVAAVRGGEITEDQIDASVLKVLRAKASVGLNKAKLVDINGLATAILKPENIAQGQEIADAAVTLVRDNGKVLPMKRGTSTSRGPYEPEVEAARQTVAVVFTDDTRTESGRTFERGLRNRVPDATIFFLDDRNAGPMSDSIMEAVKQARAVVAVTYVVPTAGKMRRVAGSMVNTVSLADSPAALLTRMLEAAADKTVVVAMGNPYVASSFPQVQNYMCTFSNGPTSDISALKGMFGEMAIRGHLPVTLPNIAERGSGIERGAVNGSAVIHNRKKPARSRGETENVRPGH